MLCSLLGQAREFIIFGQRLYNILSQLDQVHCLTTSDFNSSIINNKICLLHIGSASLVLVPTSILHLHSIVFLSAMRLFPWASWIPSCSLMSSHQCHPWLMPDIPVRCIFPGQVGIVGWGGGATFTSRRIQSSPGS